MSDLSRVSEQEDPPLIKNITGVVLAGGKSVRFGSNKALEKINGIPLIERIIKVFQPLFQQLILITNTPDEYAYLGLPMHKDLIEGLGPIGGIFSGLNEISNDAGFFVACDMPYLNSGLIRYMVQRKDAFDVVIPRISWKIETLHAIYSKRCLNAVKRSIDSQEYRVRKFFSQVSVRYIEENEIIPLDPELMSFFNVNSPQELRRFYNR